MTFDKRNYIVLAVGAALMLLGYCLMTGGGSDETQFNPDIFSPMRIRVAPIVCLIGFVVMGVAVMLPKRKKKE